MSERGVRSMRLRSVSGSGSVQVGGGPGWRGAHFGVPARELLLAEPVVCVVFSALRAVAVAVDTGGGHHVVLVCGGVRFYLGPDAATVDRRARVVAAALRDGRAALPGLLADGVHAWLVLCHEALVEAVTDGTLTFP